MATFRVPTLAVVAKTLVAVRAFDENTLRKDALRVESTTTVPATCTLSQDAEGV